jgi:hypothetical protein
MKSRQRASVLFVLGLALLQISCVSPSVIGEAGPRLVLVDVYADVATLLVNGEKIYQGPLSSKDESTGLTKIFDLRRSDIYKIELIAGELKVFGVVSDKRVRIIYLSPKSTPQIIVSDSPAIMLD